jgi:hypothetical protein
MFLTITTVLLWTVAPQPDTKLLFEQHRAYQEEQQVRAHAWWVDAERRVAQRQGELIGERAAIEAQLTLNGRLHVFITASPSLRHT